MSRFLGAFLATHPEFQFDLEEYLIATRFAEPLRERLHYFRTGMGGSDPAAGDRLREAVRELDGAVPAYQGYAALPFEALPVVRKEDLRADPLRFVSGAFRDGALWCKHTSGTTGSSVAIYYSPAFHFELLFLALRQIALRAGLSEGRSAPVFAFGLTDHAEFGNLVAADPTGETGLLVQVAIDPRDPSTVARALRLLTELRPVLVHTKPSVYEVLLDLWPGADTPAGHAPAGLISSGSGLAESLRARLEDRFGAPVVNAYGMTEFGLIASECPHRVGLHVDDSEYLVEVLDAQGRPVPPGVVGELTLSSLRNGAMPLIRYGTRDLARLDPLPCPCGSTAPRLLSFSGRIVDCFRGPGGELIPPAQFNRLFELFPLEEFQMTQYGTERVRLQVQPRGPVEDPERFVRNVGEYVGARLPAGTRVDVSLAEFGYQDKFERYRRREDGAST